MRGISTEPSTFIPLSDVFPIDCRKLPPFSELSRPTPVIQVLIGPRQVGKTTIACQIQESIRIPVV